MKVVMIGGNAKEEHYVHHDDFEVWCVNQIIMDFVPRIDRMFDIHMYNYCAEHWERGLYRSIKWAKYNKNIPFYTADEWPGIPNNVIFPRKEMEYFPRPNYHCGSFDWMTAFAIHLGATEIRFHGVGLALESGEPLSAWACLEYWCGIAEGKGIKVTTAKDCDLFYYYNIAKNNAVYGYDTSLRLVEDRT